VVELTRRRAILLARMAIHSALILTRAVPATVTTARAGWETRRYLCTRGFRGLVGETGLGRRGGRRGLIRSLCLISGLDTIGIAALGENAATAGAASSIPIPWQATDRFGS
jgi:hypothetical protein